MARNRNVRVYSVPGEMGPQPAYEWEGTKVRFTQPSGKWGEWVDLVGMKGASAFDLAKSFGFEGSEDEWLASLKGAKGDAGENGLSVYQLAVKNGFKGTVREYLDHIKVVNGKDGLSAYQVAVKNGFEGSESEWLVSLQGEKGDDGLSAYEVWLALGNRGSENDFFDWLAEKVRRLVKNIDDKGAGPLRIKLSMLTDVDVSGADENDVLTFIDGEWVAAPSGGGGGGATWGSITGTLSDQTDLQTALDGKVDENAPITGATKTKITYDAKGLVTAGADATTSDIADSTDRRYVTDAQLAVIGNTSGTNTGDQTITGGSGISVDNSTAGTSVIIATPTYTATIILLDNDTELEVGNGVGSIFLPIPPALNGKTINFAGADVAHAGTGSNTEIQIYNVTQSIDMLDTPIVIIDGDVNGTGDPEGSVYAGDRLRFDIGTVSAMPPQGLVVTLEFI